eukprot:gene20609-biopygen29363
MDAPSASTAAAFAQWIKDISIDLKVMEESNLDLPLSLRNCRAKLFILDQMSPAYQLQSCHLEFPTNIISCLKYKYADWYFEHVKDPDTDPLPYPWITFPSLCKRPPNHVFLEPLASHQGLILHKHLHKYSFCTQ